MPFYEYQCDACGAVHEAFQKMSDPPMEKCPACGAGVRKVLHPVAVHFKGSGFYATDNRKSEKYGKLEEGYDVVDKERYRRAEMGDQTSIRAIEADEKSKTAKKSEAAKPKETQPAK